MSPCSALLFTVTYMIITCCSANKTITAYVKEDLTTTICEDVPRVPGVCNIDWKVSHSASERYQDYIESINSTTSSNTLVFGLNPSDAMKCRKAYEKMLCGNSFPVCDHERMVIRYGNGTERCELVKKACTTVAIQGCEYSTNGEQAIVEEQKTCVPLLTDTSKLCPNFNMKVPKGYTMFADKYIKYLSATAEKFERQTKNIGGMEKCLKDYKEMLCRLIGGCSPDGYYSLYLIDRQECEEKVSCVKNSEKLVDVDVSMCTILPNTEGLKKITVKNPFLDEPTSFPKINEAASESTISKIEGAMGKSTTSKEEEATSKYSTSKAEETTSKSITSKAEEATNKSTTSKEQEATSKSTTSKAEKATSKSTTSKEEEATSKSTTSKAEEATSKSTTSKAEEATSKFSTSKAEETTSKSPSSKVEEATSESLEEDEKSKPTGPSQTIPDASSMAENEVPGKTATRSSHIRSAGNISQSLAWLVLVLSTFPSLLLHVAW